MKELDRLRADFEELKAAMAASAASQDPAELDRVTARLLQLDEPTIRRELTRRYAAARIRNRLRTIEMRLKALEEHSGGA
ncbi:MAG: hypothetical protein JO048_11170 [Methylobacteriaceae bacterium]|nr:hypothetical protein [Methylobacteriaceae bacterium]